MPTPNKLWSALRSSVQDIGESIVGNTPSTPAKEGQALLSDMQRRQPSQPPKVPAMAIAGGVVGTALLPMAMLVPNGPVQVASGVAALASWALSLWRIHKARQARHAAANTGLGLQALPAEAWRNLDQLMQRVAPELPRGLQTQLLEIQQTLVRMAQHTANAGVDENFTLDDHLYLEQCVSRYLPDSIHAFLLVPSGQRDVPLSDTGDSAHAALTRQLELLQASLIEREHRHALHSGQKLLAQGRFLDHKNRQP